MNASISRLVEMARKVHVTDEQKREQRKSFVYGNTKIENDKVTKEMVDSISKQVQS